jgi:tetratricopeptide (TPR) repeat protein
VFLGFVLATCAALLLLGGVQKALFPRQVPRTEVLTAPFRAIGNDAYLRLDRPFVMSEVTGLVRAFTADNIVARPAMIITERLPDGPYSLLQYAGPEPAPYWIALAALLGLAGVLVWRTNRRELIRDPLVQLALAMLAYNLVFHYFYRANGQPFIFTVHAAFPLLVLLGAVVGRSTFRFRTAGLALVAVLVGLNNLVLVRFVHLALSIPCDRPVGNVCVEWRARSEDPRFTEGVPNFMSSADYPLELGRVALEEGRVEESLPLLVRSIELDRRYLLPRLYLASALVQTGRMDDAVEHLRRSLQEFPGDPKLTLLLEDAERRRGPR